MIADSIRTFSPRVNRPRLLSVLLDIIPSLGHAVEDFMLVRDNDEVRRAIASLLVRPTVNFHQLTVNYDDPSLTRLESMYSQGLPPSLAAQPLLPRRTGTHDVMIVELFVGRSLSTNDQLELLTRLGYTTTCIAEATAAMNAIDGEKKRRLMAYIGPEFDLHRGDRGRPFLCQGEGERHLTAGRLYDRWSQEYSLLAVQP